MQFCRYTLLEAETIYFKAFFALFGSLVGKKTLFRMKGRSIYRAETTSHFDSPQEQPSLPSAEAHVENATQVTCGTRFVNSRGGEGREVGHSRKVWVEVCRPNATPFLKVLSSTLPSPSMTLELDKMIVVIVFNLFYYAILRKRETSLVYLPSQ